MIARLLAAPAWLRWGLPALGLAVLPWLVEGRFALGLASQMGIACILCLSYWLLMGPGGLLSFGHAVYSGAGAYAAIHLLRLVEAGAWLPPVLLPLAGGLAAALLALPLGWLATRHSTTAFAMITLALGELAWAFAQMFPAVFGGEAGITGDRSAGPAPPGWSLGPAQNLYALVAVYAWLSAWCIHAFLRSPAGCLLQAARDNAERVAFIGHDPRRVRLLAFVVAAFFAGIAGALAALLQEIVTPEVLGSQRSAVVLVFTFVGGVASLLGPLIGGVLMVVGFVLLSDWTPGWLLYLGLLFLGLVIFWPSGVAGWLLAPAAQPLPAGLALGRAVAAVLALASLAAMVEMAYQLRLADTLGPERAFLGLLLNAHSPVHWLACAALALVAAVSWWRLQGRVRREMA